MYNVRVFRNVTMLPCPVQLMYANKNEKKKKWERAPKKELTD
jgi:hypothetical protein